MLETIPWDLWLNLGMPRPQWLERVLFVWGKLFSHIFGGWPCSCRNATILPSLFSFLLWNNFFFSPHTPLFTSGCTDLLGMETGAIASNQLTASSVYYGFLGMQRWGPELARLNSKGIVNAWTSSNYDRNPWIQVSIGWEATSLWCFKTSRKTKQGVGAFIPTSTMHQGRPIARRKAQTTSKGWTPFPYGGGC